MYLGPESEGSGRRPGVTLRSRAGGWPQTQVAKGDALHATWEPACGGPRTRPHRMANRSKLGRGLQASKRERLC